jgi:multiple sugar transport system permease protein
MSNTSAMGFVSPRRVLLWSGIALICGWVLVPIYVIALGALGGRTGVYLWPKTGLPTGLSLEPFMLFLKTEGVFRCFLNSLGAAAITVILSLLLGAPAGYALARYNFRGKDSFRLLVLLTRAFPLAILALPLTVSFIRLGLYDTVIGVGLVHTVLALPFAALVTQGVFLGVPKELEEAAWVFGCSRIRAFFKIVAPLALPGIAATAVFAFVISWNEVFAASVLTVRNRTLTAYLLTVLAESPMHYRFAGGLLLILPSVVFIFVVRRYLFAIWGISSK